MHEASRKQFLDVEQKLQNIMEFFNDVFWRLFHVTLFITLVTLEAVKCHRMNI
jgi:hypothetical protein